MEIGLAFRVALYNLPQVIRPKCVAIPGLVLLKLPVTAIPKTDELLFVWILQVISPASPKVSISFTM